VTLSRRSGADNGSKFILAESAVVECYLVQQTPEKLAERLGAVPKINIPPRDWRERPEHLFGHRLSVQKNAGHPTASIVSEGDMLKNVADQQSCSGAHMARGTGRSREVNVN
jgi:hypothetical protein